MQKRLGVHLPRMRKSIRRVRIRHPQFLHNRSRKVKTRIDCFRYQGHFIKKQKEMKRKQKEEAKLEQSKEDNEQSNKLLQEQNAPESSSKQNQAKGPSDCKNDDGASSANETTSTDICNEEWIKANVLKNSTEFRGWKKTIKRVMKLVSGESVQKKKFKKCLRNAFQLSSEYDNQSRKEINKIIKEKITECKRIRVHDDLVVNVKKE